MDPKQVFILVLCLVPVWSTCMFRSNRCCNEQELRRFAEKKLQRRVPQPGEPAAAARTGTGTEGAGTRPPCPLELYESALPTEIKDRSLSPWRYVNVSDPDLFPPSYVKAECLCAGCLVLRDGAVRETSDYNSHPVVQSRAFLKRVRCTAGTGYQLQLVLVDVPVGCTCLHYKTAS
ncbi:interleukin-17C [Menidia menidia]